MAETREILITVHPFDPRQKKQFETGMKGMQGIKQLAQSLRFPLLLRPLSLYFFIFFVFICILVLLSPPKEPVF